MSQRASIIVGSGGQDGYYLSARLRDRGDEVIGITRTACSSSRRGGLPAVDVLDRARVAELVRAVRPAEIYYLAAFHGSSEEGVPNSRDTYDACHAVHVAGWLNILEAARAAGASSRLFYAASSHVFGAPAESPQRESTPLAPLCIYGVTKAAGMGLSRHYRATHGLFCSNGILYNHESPRRAPRFVSRKIVQAAVAISRGRQERLVIGDLSATVDWGAAEDYVAAMQAVLAADAPEDFIVASGVARPVRDFVEAAFEAVGLDWRRHVVEDASILKGLARPAPLVGDPGRLRARTGWAPRIGFGEMVRAMVDAELALAEPHA